MTPNLRASVLLSMLLESVVTIAVFSFVVSFYSLSCHGQTPETAAGTEWLIGRKLDLHLQKTISVSWSDSPIKSRLLNFARQQKVAVFVDRRVDTEKQVNLQSRDVTVEQFLWDVAEQAELGICRLDDLFYLGPAETTATLPILWQQMKSETRKQLQDYQVAWSKRVAFPAKDLVIPPETLKEFSQQQGFRITSGKLPHDIWSPVDLPTNSLDSQVALLLVGFDQWFTRSQNGEEIELVDFPKVELGQIEIGPLENSRQLLKDFRVNHPNCNFSIRGKRLTVKGTPSDLTRVRSEVVRIKAQTEKTTGEKRFSLTTKAARGNILATIAQQTGKQLEYAPEFASLLQDQVEINVVEVTLDELLREILNGTGAKYNLENGRLKIGN